MVKDQEIAFEDLYRTKYRLICQYIERNIQYDVDSTEDLADETFVILYEKWDMIRNKDEKTLTVWLYRTAENLMLTHRKKILRRFKVLTFEQIEKIEVVDETHFITEIQESEQYQELICSIKKCLSEYEWRLFEAIYILKEAPPVIMGRFQIDRKKLYADKRKLKYKISKVVREN